MSLAIMMYKQGDRRLGCRRNRRANDRKATQTAVDNTDRLTTARQSDTRDQNNNDQLVRIDGTRALGLPIVVVVTLAMLLLMIFRGNEVHAAGNNNLQLCRVAGPLAKAAVSTNQSIFNSSTASAHVICAIDALPGSVLQYARVHITSTGENTGNSYCELVSRLPNSGLANAIGLRQATSKNDSSSWLTLEQSNARTDGFKSIECNLAPGATLAELEIITTTDDADPLLSAQSLHDLLNTRTGTDSYNHGALISLTVGKTATDLTQSGN